MIRKRGRIFFPVCVYTVFARTTSKSMRNGNIFFTGNPQSNFYTAPLSILCTHAGEIS